MKFWLVQRGKWNRNSTEKKLTGNNGLIDLDYMGSAEFEFGAIPAAYRRIMAQYSQYSVHNTEIKHRNGNETLFVFCRYDMKDEIIDALKEYVENPYQTKEYTELDKWCKPPTYFEGTKKEFLPPRSNFWWEIGNGKDFMCFFGKQKIKFFKEAVKDDYENWWMAKTEEEREDDSKKAFSHRY